MYSNQEYSCTEVSRQETYDEGLDLVDKLSSKNRAEVTFGVTVYAQKAVSVYSSMLYYGKSRVRAEV